MTDVAYSTPMTDRPVDDGVSDHSAALAPWLLLGIGLGGLIDGIVFHEILQWHNMFSNAVPPTDLDRIRFNVLADGLFQAAAWLVTLFGLLLLWRSVRSGRSDRFSTGAFGALLAGFGLFNLVEGVVNHHILKLHNVREVADPTTWNFAFLLLLGVLPLALGSLLRQRAANRPVRIISHADAFSSAPRKAYLVQILLPVATRDGQPIESRPFEIVKEDLTQRFGGVTTYTRSPAESRWRVDRTHIEDVVVFEVLCNDLDRHWWNAYRQRLESDFRQQSVVVRAEPALLF